tara:strand:- start:3682 stop:3930 length:249 start_codon:yes stop_codon:yes gene_type:complete
MNYTDKQRTRIVELMETVMNEATGGFADYAKTYAMASIEAYYMYGDRGLQMQIPYVLSNLQHWRGDLAKSTKAELKKFLPKY